MGQINASDNAFGLLFFVMIWTLSTSQHISHYLSNDLHVSDQIKAFQKLLCLCLCCSLCLAWPSHLHLPNSFLFFRTAFEHHLLRQAFFELSQARLSPPSSSGLPQGPVRTSITPFDMWYYNFLFTCQVHWTVTLWKHGLSVCLLWFYFCFSAPCQVYTECGLNEQLHLEGVNIFTYIMDIGILLLPQLPHPYTETHTFSLHSGVCRLWVASSMVFIVVVEAQGRDLAEVTTRRMDFMLSPIVLVSRMCLTLDLF